MRIAGRTQAVLLFVTVLGISACSTRAGSPAPVSSAAMSPAGVASSVPDTDVRLAGISPCELLTEQQITSGGLTSSGVTNTGGGRSCQYDSPGHHQLSFVIWSDAGLRAMPASGGTVSSERIGTHDAEQVAGGSAGCDVALAVAPNSRVDVVVSAFGDTVIECQVANRYAGMIAPALPAQRK